MAKEKTNITNITETFGLNYLTQDRNEPTIPTIIFDCCGCLLSQAMLDSLSRVIREKAEGKLTQVNIELRNVQIVAWPVLQVRYNGGHDAP